MQNKQQLINWLTSQRDACDELHQDNCQREQCCANRIALEKLTAPEPVPVWWIDSTVKLPPFNYGRFDHDIPDAYLNCVETVGGVPLYAAPVVLEDVLPDLQDIPDGYDLESCMAGAAWYKQELLSRINMIESGQWKIVPVDRTSEMWLQAHTVCDANCPDCGKSFAIDVTDNVDLSYQDMLAVAPEFGK